LHKVIYKPETLGLAVLSEHLKGITKEGRKILA
jgi:hypothetical protein